MLCLNGEWEFGGPDGYQGICTVPGIPLDPTKSQALWLRRTIRLPVQPFNRLLLVLKGARFCPQVFVNGVMVSSAEGGMAATRHLFSHPDCVPDAEIELEIRLCALDDVPLWDASRIPDADLWRSNLSSCLWDDVLLYPVGSAAVMRIVPHADDAGIHAQVEVDTAAPCRLTAEILNTGGTRIAAAEMTALPGMNQLFIPAKLEPWSPEHPTTYQLKVIADDGMIRSEQTVPCGLSRFTVKDYAFELNQAPIRLRGTSVVWHRFCRDPEGRTLALHADWFEKNIIQRLKSAGANLLRFHLGAPMEKLLDLCDRVGLCVQLEWLFFHGMKACEESLIKQWRELLSLAARHPCVCIIQLWNETEGPELETAFRALCTLDREFPHAVISHRDVVHVHKYWWSLFENLNLSYDNAEDLPGAAMVDEFGGNYLDGALDVGGYPEAAGAFERFLGNAHTAAERSQLQALANARVGEYWRRIGVAGCATFCALSSPEDGNHHFLGRLADGVPKDVWQACSAFFSPRAASLELWDCSFEPGQTITANVHLINDTDTPALMRWQTAAEDESGCEVRSEIHETLVASHASIKIPAQLTVPRGGKHAVLKAYLLEKPNPVSAWPVRLHSLQCPAELKGVSFSMLSAEPELRAFALEHGLIEDNHSPQLLLGGEDALQRMQIDADFLQSVEKRIQAGAGMLLAQVGPRLLGEGYFSDRSQIRLDGDTQLLHQQSWRYKLPFDRTLRFDAQAEAESCCHPALGKETFPGLQRGALQLANGYRGGLTAPAVSMELEPTDHQGILEQWLRRGAEKSMLLSCPDCTAYELEGFYAFSPEPSLSAAQALRSRVRFLVADAPSLEKRIDPESDIKTVPLGRLLKEAATKKPTSPPTPIAVCGHGLKRVAAFAIQPEKTSGTLVLSQLLTQGRLVKGYAEPGLYGARYDPEMAQLMLLCLQQALH